MQCPAQAAFDGIERSQAEGPQRASVGLSWARGKGSRAQALFGHEPSRAWARLVQSLTRMVKNKMVRMKRLSCPFDPFEKRSSS